ncbi:MAG: hypothetical protein ACJ8KF_00960, partial [Chthoniobacterales bacterium]
MSGASAPLEQKESKATVGGNPPPVLKTGLHRFGLTFHFVSESPELGLAFAVSARFSPPRGGKLLPVP